MARRMTGGRETGWRSRSPSRHQCASTAYCIQRNDAFEVWCWRRPLRIPLTARRSNQSNLKEINPEYSLEGLMAKAEIPILWPPDTKSWPTGKDPDAGRDWGQEEEEATEEEMVGWHPQLNGHNLEQTLGDSEGQPGVLQSMGLQSQTRLSSWTTTRTHLFYCLCSL